MLLQNMSDFVGKDCGQFRFVIQSHQQAIGYENFATGQGKGVDGLGFENPECPGKIGSFRLRREPAADAIDVTLQLVVPMQRRGAEEARRNTVAKRNFFINKLSMGNSHQ